MQAEQTSTTGEPLEIMVLGMSRAHFYGKARRRVFTTLPEGFAEPGYCALLLKTMYRTEDAPSVWRDTWNDHLRQAGRALGQGELCSVCIMMLCVVCVMVMISLLSLHVMT